MASRWDEVLQRMQENMVEITGNCETHGAYQYQAMRDCGCPDCEEEELKRQNAEHEYHRLWNRWKDAGIPARYMEKTMADWNAATADQKKAKQQATEYIAALKEKRGGGKSMILCGTLGTGKTHLAAAVGKEAMAAGLSMKYIQAMDVAAMVRATFTRDSKETEEQVLRWYRQADLLVLDDVGATHGSQWEVAIIQRLLAGRYDAQNGTLITTNLSMDTLEKYLGERCMERLLEGGGIVVPMRWKSHRRTA